MSPATCLQMFSSLNLANNLTQRLIHNLIIISDFVILIRYLKNLLLKVAITDISLMILLKRIHLILQPLLRVSHLSGCFQGLKLIHHVEFRDVTGFWYTRDVCFFLNTNKAASPRLLTLPNPPRPCQSALGSPPLQTHSAAIFWKGQCRVRRSIEVLGVAAGELGQILLLGNLLQVRPGPLYIIRWCSAEMSL